MYVVLVVLVNIATLVQSQICNLDDRLHTLDTRGIKPTTSSLQSYLAFICPSGLISNSSHCIFSNLQNQPCPVLGSLNLEYNITNCNNDNVPQYVPARHSCSYPISDFFRTATDNNDIKLVLSSHETSQSLQLDVYGEKSLHNIQENLHCWEKPIDINTTRDIINAISFAPTFPTHTDDVTALRYTSPLRNADATYFCILFNPGKQKPVVSNRLNMLGQVQQHSFVVTGELNGKIHRLCHPENFHFHCRIIDGVTIIYTTDYFDVRTNLNLLKSNLSLQSEESSSEEELDQYIISNQYCLEYHDTSNGVKWCTTKIRTTTIPCETPCFDNKGNIITRTCEGSFLTGARWSQPSGYCSTNSTLPEISNFLFMQRRDLVTPTTLINISSVIRDNPNITAIDLVSISTILSNAVNQNDSESLRDTYFDAIDSLLNIKETVFSKALHSRENILNSVDLFVTKISTSPVNLTYTNLALKIYKPYLNLTNSFDQVLTVEGVSAKFPEEILQQLLNINNEEFTVAMVVFKNRKLFSEGVVVSDVADLILPGSYDENFAQPISIYIEQNSSYDEVVCAYWNYGKDTNGNWSTIGIETIKTNGTNIVECRTYHLTSFALLGISERVIEEISTPTHKAILKYISTIGCLLSLFGTCVTIYTAVACRNWYKRRINSLQLSCVVLFEVIMLFVADTFEIMDNACIAVGAIMHYLILVKFLIMLLIAKQQYSNFVSVMQSRNAPQHKLINTAIILIVPFIFVTVAASVFPYKYNSGNLSFCYPKEEVFSYFLILPISIILLANTVVFGLVMIRISNSITRGANERKLQFRLAFMLWFMLGMTWFFGIFAEIATVTWLQIVFVYVFCMFGTLQGFVVFWFTVIRDKDAMLFWRNTIELITQDDKSSTKYSTDVTLLSVSKTENS